MDTGEALGSRDALGALTRGRSSGEGTFSYMEVYFIGRIISNEQIRYYSKWITGYDSYCRRKISNDA